MADTWWTDEMTLPKARTIAMEGRRPDPEMLEAINYLAAHGDPNLIDGDCLHMATSEMKRRGLEGPEAYGEVLWSRMAKAVQGAELQ